MVLLSKNPEAEMMARAATFTTDDLESRTGIMRGSVSSQTTIPDLSRASASDTSISTAKKGKRNMFNFFRRGSEKVKESRGSKGGEILRGSSFPRGKWESRDVEVGIEREDSGISRPSVSISVTTTAEYEFEIGVKGKAERSWTEAKPFVKEPNKLSPATRIDSTRSDGWTDASFSSRYQSTSYLRASTRGSAGDDEWVGDGSDMTSLERANEYRALIGEHPFEADWRGEVALAERREAETHMRAKDTAMDQRAEENERPRGFEAQREIGKRNKAERSRRERNAKVNPNQAQQKLYEEADIERLKLGMKPWEDAKSVYHDRDTVMSNQTTWSKLITQATETPQSSRVEMTRNMVRKQAEVQSGLVSAKSLTGSIGGLSTPTPPRTPITPTMPAPFVLPSTLPSKQNSLGPIPERNHEETPAIQLSKSLSLKTIPESKPPDTKPSLLGRMLSKKEAQKIPIRPGPPTEFRHIQHTRPEDVTSSPDSKHSISLSEDQAFLMAKERLNKLALGKSQVRVSSERDIVNTKHSLEEGKSGMYRPGEGRNVSLVEQRRDNGEENPKAYRGDAISGFSQHNDTAYESWRTEAKAESQSGEVGKERGSPRSPPSPRTQTTMSKWFGLLTSNSQKHSPPPPRNITHPLPSPAPSSSPPPASTPMRSITQPLPSSSRTPLSSSPHLRAPPNPSNPFSRRTPHNPSTHHAPPSPPRSTPKTPDPFTPQLQMPKRRPIESLLAADKRLAAVSHARGGLKPPTESFLEARERTGLGPYIIPDQVDNYKGVRRR